MIVNLSKHFQRIELSASTTSSIFSQTMRKTRNLLPTCPRLNHQASRFYIWADRKIERFEVPNNKMSATDLTFSIQSCSNKNCVIKWYKDTCYSIESNFLFRHFVQNPFWKTCLIFPMVCSHLFRLDIIWLVPEKSTQTDRISGFSDQRFYTCRPISCIAEPQSQICEERISLLKDNLKRMGEKCEKV